MNLPEDERIIRYFPSGTIGKKKMQNQCVLSTEPHCLHGSEWP
jgi:hypothetical protein